MGWIHNNTIHNKHHAKISTTWVYWLPFMPFSAYETLKQCNTHAKCSKISNMLIQSNYACLSFRQDERMIKVKFSRFYLVEFHLKILIFRYFISFFVEKVQWYDYCTLHVINGYIFLFVHVFAFHFGKAGWGQWGVNLFIQYTNWHMKIENKLSNK